MRVPSFPAIALAALACGTALAMTGDSVAEPFRGSWDEIVRMMRDANTAFAGRSMQEFMATEARRGYSLTGVTIPTRDAESFIRGSADAGLLRIVK